MTGCFLPWEMTLARSGFAFNMPFRVGCWKRSSRPFSAISPIPLLTLTFKHQMERLFMKAIIQRVTKGTVTVKDEIVGRVGKGFVVFLGVGHEDNEEDARYLAKKISGMRIFEDNQGKMNLSLDQVAGGVLVISQFTLYGDTRKGNRPSFVGAAPPEQANRLYEYFIALIKEAGIPTESGIFQAEMQVEIYNDGPVTLVIESKKGD